MPQVVTPKLQLRPADTPPPLRRRAPAPAPPSRFRRRLLHYVLALVTIVLVVDALVGDNGLLETMRARRQYAEVSASLRNMRRENARLREDIRRYKEDPAAIESLAREELGLMRPGEVVFVIKDGDRK